MLDKSLIAQCAYTCDVMAKKLLKEKKRPSWRNNGKKWNAWRTTTGIIC